MLFPDLLVEYIVCYFFFVSLIASLIRSRLLKIIASLIRSRLLSGIEQVCFMQIICGRTFFSLFAKIFVNILQSIHRSEIGLQYFNLFKSPFLE